MATPFSEDIGQLLNDNGTATFGTDLFVNQWPESPDFVIACYDGAGSEPNPKWQRDFPRVQIRVRGDPNDFKPAWDKAFDIRDFLLGKSPATVNSKTISSLRMAGGDINFLQYDENRRPMFTMNFDLVVDNAGGQNRGTL